MANAELYAFNRGLISPQALARTDLARTALSAEIMTNFSARVLGAMSLRPGMKYLGQTADNGKCIDIPFVKSATDTARIEITGLKLRVWVNDALVERSAVTSTISNGAFDVDLTGWTDDDQGTAASTWETGGYMSLVGTGPDQARRYQEVTVTGANINSPHSMRITIERGPVLCRIGSTQGGDEYLTETSLRTGQHSICIEPSGNFFIQFESYLEYKVLVDSIEFEGAGPMELTTIWPESVLELIRFDQSADVVFVACDGYRQQRIERRQTICWSVVDYQADDGPFGAPNLGAITLTPSALSGDITVTASAPLFRSEHVGSLWNLTSSGQRVEETFTAVDQVSDYIRVTGIDGNRKFTITRSGDAQDVDLQRSLAEPGDWAKVTTYTLAGGSAEVNDGLDNQVVYYRMRCADAKGGSADWALTYPNGGIDGRFRITAFTSATSVSAAVVKNIGQTNASTDWREPEWSDHHGWPSATKLYEGRLWWVGKGKFWGSVSDAYESFDDSVEGDSGPINRLIGYGPVDRMNWLQGVERLIAGSQGSEYSIRASSFDEPLTPDNFNVKDPSTQGSADVQAAKVDASIIFVQRSKIRVFEIAYNIDDADYASRELTILYPEAGGTEIRRIAVQRQPDTRIHCVRSDGRVAVCVFNKAEDVVMWQELYTDGIVEEVSILPGDIEDDVQYTVKRTINTVDYRYKERLAREDEVSIFTTIYDGASTATITLRTDDEKPLYADGTILTARDVTGTIIENVTVSNAQVTLSAAATYAHLTPATVPLGDSYLVTDNSGSASTQITGLGHLEAKTASVWADGRYQGDYTVNGGTIDGLPEAVEHSVTSIPYSAWYKSTKLAYADKTGASLTMVKRVTQLGFVLYRTHHQGIQYGASFDNLYDLAQTPGHTPVKTGTVYAEHDERPVGFPGEHNTDSRVCLKARSPKPCVVLAAVLGFEKTNKS